MNKKIISTFSLLSYTLISPFHVFAQEDALGPEPAGFGDLERIFSDIVGFFLPLAMLAVFVMLVIGGYRYMLSGGDPAKNQAARGTITWAIVGLLFLLGSWFILQIIQTITGAQVTEFNIISN